MILNCSDREVTLDGVHGQVLIGTDRARDGAALKGSPQLRSWEGLVAELHDAGDP